MDRLLRIGTRHTAVTLIAIAVITLAAVLQLPGLRLEITAEGMMVQGDPARELYVDTLEVFGSENVTVLYFESADVLDSEQLRAIAGAVSEIERSDLVTRSLSLFSLRYLRTIDEFTYTSPYLKPVPDDPAELDRRLRAALQNPLVRNNLLTDDRRGMAINIYVDPRRFDHHFDERFSALVDDAIADVRPLFDDVFFIGNPYVRAGLTERIRADQQVIIPGAIALLLLTLALVLRRLVAPLIPLVTALISIVWILGLMAWLGIPLNVTTSVVPALLIIIGSTEDIHLLAEYRHGELSGLDKPVALDAMARNMGIAVVLTFVTTYAGFLSITANRLDLLQQFGVIASTGLLFNFVVTVLLVPVFLKWLPQRGSAPASRRHTLIDAAALCVFDVIDRHRYPAIAVLVAIVVVAGFNASSVRINNSIIDYFDDDSELVVNAGKLHRRLAGIETLSVIVRGRPGTFEQIPYLEELWNLQDRIADDERFDSSHSFADFIGIVHSGLDAERPGEIYLPDTNDAVRAYLAFLQGGIAGTLISPDYSEARIVVRHNVVDSTQLNQLVAGLVEDASTWLDPSLELAVTGESYLNSRAVDYMAEGQGYSLAIVLTTIFVVVAVLFANHKAGIVAVVANLFPIVVLFGVMGYFDLALNTSTAMVAAVSLGIGVDYSMHFMVRYYRLSRTESESAQALRNTVQQEALPIIASAVALAASFSALTVSDFPPVARFGQLSALVMVLSLVSTFVIAPLMLRYVRLVTVWDLLSVQIQRRVIENSPIFRGMRAWQARKILALSTIRKVEPDEAVIMQGERIEHVYLILDGAADGWRTRSDGSTYLAARYLPGEVFGVLLPGSTQRCTTDVVATESTRILLLDWNDLNKITRVAPRLGVKLFRNISSIVSGYIGRVEASSAAIHDELSGAFNPAVFRELIGWSVLRTRRYPEELSLVGVTVDIDLAALKGGNAHHRSNLVMREVAASIRGVLRASDILGRWDDHSFCVLLANSDQSAARHTVERLNACLDQRQLRASIGIDYRVWHVSLRLDETEPEAFMQRFEAVRGTARTHAWHG